MSEPWDQGPRPEDENGGVSLAQARAFLADRYPAEAVEPRVLGHGEWSTAYFFRSRGESLVIRFSELGQDFEKDRLAAAFAAPDLPIPRVLEIGEAHGGFFALSEWVPGAHIDDLDGPTMRHLLPSLLGTLDALRRVDVSHTAGYGLWGSDGNAPHASWAEALVAVADDAPEHRFHGWSERLDAVGDARRRFDRALDELQRLAPEMPGERHLVHSDLLHFNVLASRDQVTGVIDWGSSLYGDFVYDVAWLRFFQPWYPAWRGIDFAGSAKQLWESLEIPLPDYERRVRCYELHIGLDALAYCAFAGRSEEEIDEVSGRVMEVLDQAV